MGRKMGRSYPQWRRGIFGYHEARQRGDVSSSEFHSNLRVTRELIDRLGIEKELNGHSGCVNCLEWNDEGTVLASASDDLHVRLWDPFKHKCLRAISTGHSGNIFSVKFLSPDVIATCAADSTVRVQSVIGNEGPLMICSCHCGRVKRLARPPANPHLFWSAGEDGLILQHDIRTEHRCRSTNTNILINLINHMGRYAEAKCLAVNPRRPEMLAVGANDYYVRLYDTRMIKLGSLKYTPVEMQNNRPVLELNPISTRAGLGDPDSNIPRHAVTYYAPGHLAMAPNDPSFPKKSTTYVAFSEDGTELLVNLGSEQVYIYDLNSAKRPTLLESFIIEHNHGYKNTEVRSTQKNGTSQTIPMIDIDANKKSQEYELPEDVAELKKHANDLMGRNRFYKAVDLYNLAISRCPHSAVLYSNRAAALMRRAWAGDVYAAIKDCYSAIRIDSSNVKAHFRLAKALMELRYAREAHECLLYFKDRFPKQANSHAVYLLQKDINNSMENLDTQADEMVMLEVEDNFKGASLLERQLRSSSLDYAERYIGHCNTTTDIKEANFLSKDYIAAGSDDGNIFIWCRKSGNIVRILRGDESIVNCIQVHPKSFLIATSGIENVVRLWSPRPEDGTSESRLVHDAQSVSVSNQQRMSSDPFEAMLLNISFAGDVEGRDVNSCRPT